VKDIRGQAKKEREYSAQNPPRQCVVCGRWFRRRRGNVCSIACAQKAAAKKPDAPQSAPDGRR
jgi:hypothetical protein